jgi:hypothetical protein
LTGCTLAAVEHDGYEHKAEIILGFGNGSYRTPKQSFVVEQLLATFGTSPTLGVIDQVSEINPRCTYAASIILTSPAIEFDPG